MRGNERGAGSIWRIARASGWICASRWVNPFEKTELGVGWRRLLLFGCNRMDWLASEADEQWDECVVGAHQRQLNF